MAASAGGLPWISLELALTFGLYGLLRKVAPMAPLVSLSIETALLCPVAAFYLAWLEARGGSAFSSSDPRTAWLLILAGVVTALPLHAAERLRLSTLGLFQYLAPSGHFFLAVLAYGEPFTPAHGVAFGCIWIALAVYSMDAVRAQRTRPSGDPALREPFVVS
ncbi:MAG TPA: hypothetical protein VKM54_19610 [Myxococcota bacterium]|nr:hypothetical protein [Myxococcota bacterium]